MKPIFQRLTGEPEEGFAFKTIRAAGFDCPWHVHPEHELILVRKGYGYRIVGDNMAALSPGDLVFVGAGLPHIWQEEQGQRPGGVEALIIQFETKFLGDGLLMLPALEPVRRLLLSGQRGLHVLGPTRKAVSALMDKMARTRGLDRIVQFLRILGCLADSADCHPIASPDFTARRELYDQERMDRVFQFLTSQLGREIRLSEAAELVHLSGGAFSRFFRAHAGKTFPAFLNELRIGRVCRVLTEDEMTITEAAFGCGFTNLSNFNRQFLRLKGMSPREFRKRMQERLPGPQSAQAPGQPHDHARGGADYDRAA